MIILFQRFDQFLKKYDYHIKNKKIYFETYNVFKDFVPNYIELKKKLWSPIKNNLNYEKKIIYFLLQEFQNLQFQTLYLISLSLFWPI